jgi:hypothetical protein
VWCRYIPYQTYLQMALRWVERSFLATSARDGAFIRAEFTQSGTVWLKPWSPSGQDHYRDVTQRAACCRTVRLSVCLSPIKLIWSVNTTKLVHSGLRPLFCSGLCYWKDSSWRPQTLFSSVAFIFCISKIRISVMASVEHLRIALKFPTVTSCNLQYFLSCSQMINTTRVWMNFHSPYSRTVTWSVARVRIW